MLNAAPIRYFGISYSYMNILTSDYIEKISMTSWETNCYERIKLLDWISIKTKI